jgi:hypothetical protein
LKENATMAEPEPMDPADVERVHASFARQRALEHRAPAVLTPAAWCEFFANA